MLFQFQSDQRHDSASDECISEPIRLDLNSLSDISIESESIAISKDLIMLKRMISDIKINTYDDDQTSQMLQSNDIIPFVYEGGFKTWECALDLARYLTLESLIGMRVLELGCGSGLPGILALMNNAHVTFQDYNVQVLKHATLPNVLLNMNQDAITDFNNGIFQHLLPISKLNAEFWAGDWKSLSQYWINHEKYDLILSSETIYESSSYQSFTKLIDTCLKPNGRVLIAAKYQYFGCTGSLNLFINHVKEHFPLWSIETVISSTDGVRRAIVQIKK